MPLEEFGVLPDGSAVFRARVEGGGLVAHVLSYGAALQDLRLEGHAPPLVLGLNSLDDYLAHSPYFGATAGRCANRVGNANFKLDGRSYRLDRNFLGKHQLHGGSDGLGGRNWTIAERGGDFVRLTETLPDGHMGYPGTLRVSLTVSLPGDGVMDLRYHAQTDAPTLCNLAHHSYFNLSGDPDLSGHRLEIAADRVTEVDGELIPTGQNPSVGGTAYDFRDGIDLGGWDTSLLLDHNFVLADRRQALRPVARLTAGRLAMEIRTTEPGLQVYDGAKLDLPVAGLDGARYGPRAGMAMEPQVWPDAINHAGFPSAVLRPGEVYDQHSQFVFSRL